jgi:DNA-binding NarL/FixJ family response regulator
LSGTRNDSDGDYKTKTSRLIATGRCSSSVSLDTPNRYSTSIRTSEQAVQIILYHLYSEGSKAERMEERNDEIRRLFAEGVTKAEIARRFRISERRVGQVIEEEDS